MKIFSIILFFAFAATIVSARSNTECFWTGNNCNYYSGDSMQHWISQPGEQDPRIQYSWDYYPDYGWSTTNPYYGAGYNYRDTGYNYRDTSYVYPTIVDYGRWGTEADYGAYYYRSHNTVWRDSNYEYYYPSANYDYYYNTAPSSSEAGYFYMIKNEPMEPLYKKGCWNGHCEWYNIHDPEDYIRWTDLQNAIQEDCNGNASLCS